MKKEREGENGEEEGKRGAEGREETVSLSLVNLTFLHTLLAATIMTGQEQHGGLLP